VGRTDVEDALLRLENAILEETRMAGAETLKGINVLQDMFQGFDERIKDISQKGTNSAQITVQSVMFITHSVFMVRCREQCTPDGK
jgi:hypothetical protein